ncbi:MAG: hypothetical protein JXA03_08435 [Bacteroidales bacterium]|nr:hypothetical protein [Bacteroidales bacterium]
MKSRQNVYVFLVCLFFSIMIWLLIVLSRDYSTSLPVSIEYDKVPNNLLLVGEPENKLILNLKTNGWNILKYKYLKKHPTVLIDLSSLNLKRENGFFVATVLTSRFQAEISDQLDLPTLFNELIPREIQLEFEAVASKKVPVVADLQLSFKKQYSLSDSLLISPDSVLIFGSAENLSGIKTVRTLQVAVENADQDKTLMTGIYMPGDQSIKRVRPEEVEIFIPVSEYTEETIVLPVHVEGGDGLKFKTFPEEVSLVYHVPLRHYARVSKGFFEVSALYDPEKPEADNRLPLTVKSRPAFVKVVKISPDRVEYIIIKETP